jgi:hypothetical protein
MSRHSVMHPGLPPEVLAGGWIGPRTPLMTPHGPVAAGELRVGETVLTRAGEAVAVRALRRCHWPARGAGAPVRLRAPFFGGSVDLRVTPGQLVSLSGVDVEYLFGEELVLVEARHLLDGRRALLEERVEPLGWVTLELEQGAVLDAGGCGLALEGMRPVASGRPVAAGRAGGANRAGATTTAPPPRRTLPRLLEAFEVRALQAMRRGGAIRSAA